ncbi:MAG: hypothetical protein H6817_10870 [Phycisphaerales bacterium]|nr:hypothetical protein [Phycisphaerales bacterium]
MRTQCKIAIPRIGLVAITLLLTGICGCPPEGPGVRNFGAPLPINDIVASVNTNTDRISGTLKAVGGHARGVITDTDGERRNFDMDAALLVLPPRSLRLDLKALLESQLVFGSNSSRYWVVQPGIRALSWGRHDQPLVPDAHDLLIRPDLFVEALGLNGLPVDTTGTAGPMQRVTAQYQQLLFINYDDTGQGFVEKEYWITRDAPHRIARIVFRDKEGQVAIDSNIGDYRRVGDDGPLLPHRIDVVAPATNSRLLFTAWSWTPVPEVTATHPAFTFPLDRGQQFDRIVDLDVELDHLHNPPSQREQLEQIYGPLN